MLPIQYHRNLGIWSLACEGCMTHQRLLHSPLSWYYTHFVGLVWWGWGSLRRPIQCTPKKYLPTLYPLFHRAAILVPLSTMPWLVHIFKLVGTNMKRTIVNMLIHALGEIFSVWCLACVVPNVILSFPQRTPRTLPNYSLFIGASHVPDCCKHHYCPLRSI